MANYSSLGGQNPTESELEYCEGGYHPINRKDVLNDRFEVFGKLGHTERCTIWLCWDQKDGKWRAVKVLTARYSADKRAATYQHILKVFPREILEQNHFVIPNEDFWIEGPNGGHFCLVLPVLGPSLRRIVDFGFKEQKDMILQAAAGLKFLHKTGFCHGDFRPANILLRLPSFDSISREEMDRLLGKQDEFRVFTSGERTPEKLLAPVNIPLAPLPEVAILGLDWFQEANPPDEHDTPKPYAPPESWLGSLNLGHPPKIGRNLNVWSFVVSILEMLVGYNVFDHPAHTDSFIVKKWEELLGPLPNPHRAIYLKRRGRDDLLRGTDFNLYMDVDVTMYEDTEGIPPSMLQSKMEGKIKYKMVKEIVPENAYQRDDDDDDQKEGEKKDGVQKPRFVLKEDLNSPIDPLKQVLSLWKCDYEGVADFDPELANDQLADLVRKGLDYNETTRLDLVGVVSHPFFTSTGKAPETPVVAKISSSPSSSDEKFSPVEKSPSPPPPPVVQKVIVPELPMGKPPRVPTPVEEEKTTSPHPLVKTLLAPLSPSKKTVSDDAASGSDSDNEPVAISPPASSDIGSDGGLGDDDDDDEEEEEKEEINEEDRRRRMLIAGGCGVGFLLISIALSVYWYFFFSEPEVIVVPEPEPEPVIPTACENFVRLLENFFREESAIVGAVHAVCQAVADKMTSHPL